MKHPFQNGAAQLIRKHFNLQFELLEPTVCDKTGLIIQIFTAANKMRTGRVEFTTDMAHFCRTDAGSETATLHLHYQIKGRSDSRLNVRHQPRYECNGTMCPAHSHSHAH